MMNKLQFTDVIRELGRAAFHHPEILSDILSDPKCEELVGEERRGASACMGSVVVRKLGKREEVDPVILLVVDEAAQILLEGLVGALSLSVRFRMESRRERGRSVAKLEKLSPEMGTELGAPVADDI
jgi:hypothetical protein